MRFKLKNKLGRIIIVISFMATVALLLFLSNSWYKMPKIINRADKISAYLASLTDAKIIKVKDFDHKLTSITWEKDEKLAVANFDYETGENLTIENIIKPGQYNNFKKKVNELLALKYPRFISEVLEKTEPSLYSFQDQELILYYDDYEIEPNPREDLFLKINYNEIYSFLTFTVPLSKEYTRENGFAIAENKKHLAITFDDGPSAYTSELVTILNENKAHSTFFFVGQKLLNAASTVKQVASAGNEIGYHSFNHTSFKRQDSVTIQNEFNTSNEYLKGIIGKTFSLTRPPYGSINEKVKASIATPFILWQIDTNDWRYKNVDYLVNYVLEHAQDGDIILFHDSYATSIEAVAKLLPILYSEGFQMVTVSDLAKIKNVNLMPHESYHHF